MHELGLRLAPLGGNSLIDDHEEGRPAAGDALDARPDDDVAAADRLVGGDPVSEVGPHGGPEVPLEAGGPEVEHPLDVGVEPLVVEGGHGHGEASSEVSVGGGGVGGAAVGADQRHQLEDQQDDEQRQDDPTQHSAADAAPTDGGVDSGGDADHEASVSSAQARERAIWVAAAVLAVIVGILAIVLTTRGQSANARQDEVKRTAERFAVALSTYDYRQLDRDLGKVRSMGIGNFRYQYQDVLGANSFSKALTDNQAVATAKVTSGPFTAALSNDDARTFTVVSQTIKGKSAPQGETRNVRVESILVRTPKGWRVDWVQIS
jgi:hypothetical protein